MRATLVVVADAVALAQTVAERFAAAAGRAIAERGRFSVALAGGSTPTAAYAILADEPFRTRVDWANIRFFFGDERCVPPTDRDSNYGMAKAALFDPLAIATESVFRIRGEDDPPVAAAAYAEVLRRELGADARLDLLMLGMGPDGHTASLFPGVPTPLDSTLVVANFVPKLGSWRISIAPRVIAAARCIEVATAGPVKAAALAHALDDPIDPARYPVQFVRAAAGETAWIVDRAAAADLRPA
ncbi:MAG: 6-phosphogluconolactonase [Vulcanimicrobiaceae bacterium]